MGPNTISKIITVLTFALVNVLLASQSCDKTRKVFTDAYGEISDGTTNYTKDSHCEWLIRAKNSSQFISLNFKSISTECSYDYIFVYDGDSFRSKLLGSFSGKTEPQNVVATSGSMLILLYSDTNYVLDGFKAEFSITNCPNNCSSHGKCVLANKVHQCVCNGNYMGPDCTQQACPNNCNSRLQQGRCSKINCECDPNFAGKSCSLRKISPPGNEYHWLADSFDGFYARAAHTAIYLEETDSLYVYGGYNLNRVMQSMQIYRFDKSQWENEFGIKQRNPMENISSTLVKAILHADDAGVWGLSNQKSYFKNILLSISENDKSLRKSRSAIDRNEAFIDSFFNQTRPSARYGHAAIKVKDGFVIFGGKQSNGELANDLWLYNISEQSGMRWSLRAKNSKIQPPPLTHHTLTMAINFIYLFGGSMSNGEFSSKLFRIKIQQNKTSEEQWEEVKPRGGKPLDVRVVAHTTVYHSPINSLIVYGGVTTGVARFSKLSDKMFAFHLENLFWTEILYPRTYLRDAFVPRERAFHTTTIVGNYLIVFGGYSHKHNKEEICYDNQMYLYHLGCHTWIHPDVLGPTTERSRYPKQQGVFAHAAAIRKSTVLLVGGYHGNVNSDLIAYSLPTMVHESRDPEKNCHNYQQNECLSNPDCGWCSADNICYGRTVGANCTTNLQTTRCPGICPSLGNCHSCLIFGNSTKSSSVTAKLGLDKCTWCVQNARCHHKDDNFGVCGEETPSKNVGWWGKNGVSILDVKLCSKLDKRPGLTFIKYLNPVNFSMPDHVSIVNATMIDFNLPAISTHTEQGLTGEIVARLLGFILLPDSWSNTGERLWVCCSYSEAELHIKSSTSPSKLVASLTAETTICVQADWPPLEPDKLLIDLQAKRSLGNQNFHYSKIGIQHNRSTEGAKAFTFEYLEPFSNGSCNLYSNCLECLTDSLCAWCELTNLCISRHFDEKQFCKNGEDWQYMTIHPTKCNNCSNYISCEQCVDASSNCEWWNEDARCARRGRSEKATKSLETCPTPCNLRNDCSSCLDNFGRCVWCKSTKKCFSFSVYTSEFQFGLCREWMDQLTSTQSESWNFGQNESVNSQRCRTCSSHTNCSSCLTTLNCGWCFDRDNPIQGICMHGDFNSSTAACSVALKSASSEVEFAYAQCPDVDECGLGIHDCHKEAKCTNTHGSYSCQCRKGFVGDGKRNCIKTCYEQCIHGICSGEPHYTCDCDLGWTGADCSINCGCNNHSTCSKGVNKCDSCEDWSEGEFCERCMPGSFGNASTNEGCRKCDCNEHGNKSLEICDSISGECYCQDNTEGLRCEICNREYYGDPRDGGQCYFQCEPRGVLHQVTKQGLGSYQSYRPPWGGIETRECLWIISPHIPGVSHADDYIIKFEIERNEMNVSCANNAIYVYDGLPDLTGAAQQKQLLAVFCNEDQSQPQVVEAKSGHLTIYYRQGNYAQGFNAVYSVKSCNLDTCKSPYTCIQEKCSCPEGLYGPHCLEEKCPFNCNADKSQGICDQNYGRCLCNYGFAGEDCSNPIQNFNIVFIEVFNSRRLNHGLEHLRKTIPRFGHTLVYDRRGSIWMFGGYSLSHGALNDIRQFDTKNNTWLQVTIDFVRPEDKMPEGRYFHAAEMIPSKQAIYIYGGLSSPQKNDTAAILDDFWRFSLQSQRWEPIETRGDGPPSLAGHTLTIVRDQEREFLLLIGGLSFELHSHVWLYSISDTNWTLLNTSGASPNGVFGHSTVNHQTSQILYVFGGYQYEKGKLVISNKLFAFDYLRMRWTELPPFEELNRPSDFLTRGRFLHSAISTENYMVVYGGRTSPHNVSDVLVAYVYKCNQWIRLTEGVSVVGEIPIMTSAQAATLDGDGAIFVVGGWDGSSTGRITKIQLPADLCALWSSGKYMCRHFMGCSFCAIKPYEEDESHCYSNGEDENSCSLQNVTTVFNKGASCDNEWIGRRNCSSFLSCTSCLAYWPSHGLERIPACHWCGNCVSANINCTDNPILDIDECPEILCSATNCQSCNNMVNCSWTFNGQTYQCMSKSKTKEKTNVNIIKLCPPKCSSHRNCSTCLRASSSEGAYDECYWSTQLSKCISPSFQPLYCTGGVCGLIMSPDDKDYCPEPCNAYDQCQTCLRHAHCGWCSKRGTDGEGVCTEGSLADYPAKSTCDVLYANARNATIKPNDRFAWNYVKCPPEDECSNGHHNCDSQSQICFDLSFGYECRCAEGYKLEVKRCLPVCKDGCVRGKCVEPNKCECDFGYVGANCSIQCQCNGHANCASPDKLEECEECHNNTMGAQCEKCLKFFVKNGKNDDCIPCSEYCYGHTDICIPTNLAEKFKAFSKELLEDYLTEGISGNAICLNCQNFTYGQRCDSCMNGYFRGTTSRTDSCRPCECHGHGDSCDPNTGEKCNCANNTESDPTCTAKSIKNSVYPCWNVQCAKCKDSYAGHPTDNHQCYKQITVESKMCFDAKTIDECKLKPKPLQPGETVFFVVQPRFMNVDIRIIIDVTQGELNLFMSPQDDSFVVFPNASNGFQEVYLDHKYRWTVDDTQRELRKPINFSPIINRFRNLTEDERHYYPPGQDCKTKMDGFYVKDHVAADLSTYLILHQCNTLLRVFGLKNRLVITLPQAVHSLSGTRFFIALQATSDNQVSYGLIFFRQDQLHIDLFVFFSVFFSCFFLFLAICVVAWKAKQAAAIRRARRRHNVELAQMAQRPFSHVVLYVGLGSIPLTSLQNRWKTLQNCAPIAYEPTSNSLAAVATVLVSLPGRYKTPVHMALGSTLITLGNSKRGHTRQRSQM